jgi:EAL domain-containing protein (putative c-di-GMP-specific phosphodiesterase class I)
VDLATGQIVGLEALMWWNHPARGLLPSAAFIPVAEANGSIVEIGQWAIERACRQIGMWRDQGIAPRVVAVNISAGQFRSPGGLDRIVAEGLAKYDVPPGRLELELTEQVLLETMQRHGEDFERLRRIGVGIAVDDFGVGYASFENLRMFRVGRLKIDRRFIEGVLTDPGDAAIVRAMIGLARQLGIEVVAEGVETAEQRAFLVSTGCEFAQGYFLGSPMPAALATACLQGGWPLDAV